MKNIAVFVHNLSVEYSISILHGITDFFSDKEVRLFISQTQLKFVQNSLFDYQFWASTDILNAKNIDGVIVVSGSYTSNMDFDEFKDFISKFPDKPVISIGTNPGLNNIYYTICDCNNIYDEIVQHLVKVHGCKKIAFMSANPTKSDEAIQRFEAYKNALAKNNLTFDPELVYDAYFTKSTALRVLREKLASKDSVKFDAIISANDLMAAACLEHITSLGFSVPQDIKIVGFDNTSHSSMCNPTLSTIDQQIPQQGWYAAQILNDILDGKEVTARNESKLEPIYRQSCGCINIDDKNLTYKNREGKILTPAGNSQQILNQYLDIVDSLNHIPTLIDMLKTDRTLQEFSFQLRFILDCSGLSSMAVCYYENPVTVEKGADFSLPDSAYLSMYVDNEQNFQDFYGRDIHFNPQECVLPEILLEKINGKFILYPIFAGDKQFGYLAAKSTNNQYSAINVYLRIIINSLVQAYLYTDSLIQATNLAQEKQALHENNTNLSYQSKIDELTQILNRRSFMRYGQQLIDFSLDMDTDGIVIFADLDGLKTINDSFGHDIGDISIKTEAEVLKSAFRKADIVGRLSGDEFAIIAPGMPLAAIPYCRKKIVSLNKKLSKERKLPIELSISIGAVEFNKNNKNLRELLAAADEQLYIEKKEKHAKRDKAAKEKKETSSKKSSKSKNSK